MEDDKISIACAYKFDVFICYAYEDKEWVNYLVALLESSVYKLKCCIHERDFETGTSTLGNIGKHLAASKKFILVITSAFNKSKWCEYERDQILGLSIEEKERVVIPAVLEECSLPKSISHITYAPVSMDFTESWFDKITMALDVKEIHCSVCAEEGMPKKGCTRCPECKASFCIECDKQHSRMPISKTHKVARARGYSEAGEKDDTEGEWSELQNSQFKVKIMAKGKSSDDRGKLGKYFLKMFNNLERRLTKLEAEQIVHSDYKKVTERSKHPKAEYLLSPKIMSQTMRRHSSLPERFLS